jgi:hypothetical protein
VRTNSSRLHDGKRVVRSGASAAGGDLAPALSRRWSSSVTSSIWDTSATQNQFVLSDAATVELGVRFIADVDGSITGIRFYKAPPAPLASASSGRYRHATRHGDLLSETASGGK